MTFHKGSRSGQQVTPCWIIPKYKSLLCTSPHSGYKVCCMYMGISQVLSCKGSSTTSQWKHLEIIFLQKQGKSYGGITQKVGVPKTTVYNICMIFRKHSTAGPLHTSDQPSTWTQKDVYKVNEWIKADPDITTKELTQKFNENGTIVFS